MADEDSDFPEAPPQKRGWAHYAWRLFHNPYNYSVLGGVSAIALITGAWWLMIGAGAAEALWLIYGPDNRRLRNALDMLDSDAAAGESAGNARGGAELTKASLPPAEQARFQALLAKRDEIRGLAAQNNAFTQSLMANEMGKLQTLTDSFFELASTRARYRDYLDRENVGELEQLARTYEKEANATPDGPVKELAKKNRQIVLSRLERLKDIKQFVDRAGGQLELIENSFGLIADQIVSMRSPGELSDQLDDLLDGVEAVRETAKEADAMIGQARPQAQGH